MRAGGRSWLPGDRAGPAAFPGLPSGRLSPSGARSRVTVARPRRIPTGFPRRRPVKRRPTYPLPLGVVHGRPRRPSAAGGLDAGRRRAHRPQPGRFCVATLTITTLGLALDRYADLGLQFLLGVCTWGFLAIAFAYLTPMERAQTSVVVVVATMAEVIGSILWGIYEYRLGNLPLFVPGPWPVSSTSPGCGSARRAGRPPGPGPSAWRSRRSRDGRSSAWSLAARTWPARWAPRSWWCSCCAAGRRRSTPGSFAVAYLEIYGTAIGTWTWAEQILGLGVPDGNPPAAPPAATSSSTSPPYTRPDAARRGAARAAA